MKNLFLNKIIFLGLLTLILGFSFGFANKAEAAISFISSATSTSNTVTIGTHTTNDLIIMMASAASNGCTISSGWTSMASSSISGFSSQFAYKIAASNNETSGTWTGCTKLAVTVYRGENTSSPFGGGIKTTGSSNSITYGAITMSVTNGTSWVVGSAVHQTATTNGAQIIPTGMINRADTGSTAPRTASHDTNGGVSSWTSQSTGASSSYNWTSYVWEILAANAVDTTNPVPGNSGTISTSNTYDTSLTLNWTKATDDVSIQSALQYRIYQSATNNIDTITNIEANGTPLNSYTTDIASLDVINLSPNTTNYFNVIVKDLAGNKAAYTMKSAITQSICSRNNFLTDFSAGTNGAALTGALLDSSTFGVTGSNWSVTNGSTNLIFSADADHILGGSIQTLCANPWSGDTGSLGASLLIDNTFRYGTFTFPPDVADVVTVGYWFKSDYPSSQSGVNIDTFDIMGTANGTDFANIPFQVSNGSLKILMENPGHTSGLVSNINPNTWYWVTIQYSGIADGSKGMRMSVYDENFNLLGTLPGDESRTPANPQKPTQIKFGHFGVAAAGNLPGSHLYYDNILVCYKGTCPFPLLPTDTTAPTVTAFGIPSTSNSLTVSITTPFTATDNVAVTGYLVNEVASTPSVGAAGWSGTAQTTYTFSSAGSKTLYAWAKDAAGNVSGSLNDSVTITLPDIIPPTVDVFTIPATSTSLTVSGITFTASDAVGVTGYMLTESDAAPAPDDSGWAGSAQTEYVFATEGAKTLYAWAKDAAGNISSSLSDSVTITLPTYTIGGIISGLSGTVVLQNNAGDNLSRSANGSFTFATALHDNDAYAVTVFSQPEDQTCTVTNGTDTVSGANVTNISVTCEEGADSTPPTVDSFILPATSDSLTVSITEFTATDTVGVTGYKLTETADAPLASDSGWADTVFTSYTFSSAGTKTLYAWAKDAAGNVSGSLNDSVTITIAASDNSENDEENYDKLDISKVKYSIVSENQIKITFITNNKANETVRYGTDRNLKQKKSNSKKTNKHTFNLKNLNPGITYYFRISAEDTHNQKDRTKIYSLTLPKAVVYTAINGTAPETSAQGDSDLSGGRPNQETLNQQTYAGDTSPNVCSYAVQSGDTLWRIALQIYGDATDYPIIIEKNKDKYPDIESKLSIGQELTFGCNSENQSVVIRDDAGSNDPESSNPGSPQEGGFRWWNPFTWF